MGSRCYIFRIFLIRKHSFQTIRLVEFEYRFSVLKIKIGKTQQLKPKIFVPNFEYTILNYP